MPSIPLSLTFVVVILPLLALPGASLDFKETILNLEEGSTLNYSTGVESSESLQSILSPKTRLPAMRSLISTPSLVVETVLFVIADETVPINLTAAQ
jgi:hypothetical protein